MIEQIKSCSAKFLKDNFKRPTPREIILIHSAIMIGATIGLEDAEIREQKLVRKLFPKVA